jgi:hypothetical protein
METNDLVFVDFENVHEIDTTGLKPNVTLRIIVGDDQNKVPFSLVQELQAHGKNINWIKVTGKGKNALDFFIAYYLGVSTTKNESTNYYIYSNDKGFDPLINHLSQSGINIQRISNLKNLCVSIKPNQTKSTTTKTKESSSKYDDMYKNIEKLEQSKRPKTVTTLHGHIKTFLGKKATEKYIEELYQSLLENNAISESGKKIIYNI